MKLSKHAALVVSIAFGSASLACSSSDPTGSGGEGTLVFTTWGEEYIEDEIPADPEGGGFVDGWSVSYDKFLVSFQNIVVADARGDTAGGMQASRLFDNTLPGVKAIAVLDGVAAKAWDRVSYEIAPVVEDTELSEGVPEADKQLMIGGGYSLYVSGVASKDDVEKRFGWGFAIGTRYEECQAEEDGRVEPGVVVTNNGQLTAELTTHGDHLFYDRLQSSPDPSVPTSLRFEGLAAADADADGTITLEELDATPLDVRTYDPSGLGAATLGAFVTRLARTVGHFRGEGECTVRAL
jgi:hypothetical protein